MNDAVTKVVEFVSVTGLINITLILFLSIRLLMGELGLVGAVKLRWSVNAVTILLLAMFALLTIRQLVEVLK